MGRCGGFCGDSYGGGFNRDHVSDNFASGRSNVVHNKKVVYYEKEDCYKSKDESCCGNHVRDHCGGWSNGFGDCSPCGSPCGREFAPCGRECSPCGPRRFYGCGRPYEYRGRCGGFGTPSSKLYKDLGYNAARRSGWNGDRVGKRTGWYGYTDY